MKLRCPGCSRAINARDEDAGLKMVCQQCGAKFLVPSLPAVRAPIAARNPDAILSPRDGAHLAVNQGNVYVHVEAPSPSAAHSLGITSLVLAILSLALAIFPPVGLAIACLSLALGIAGLIVALRRKGSGIGFAIGGAALSGMIVAGYVVMLIVAYQTVRVAAKALEKVAEARLEEPRRAQEGKSDEPAAPKEDLPRKQPVRAKQAPPARQVVTLGNARVSVVGAWIAPVRVKPLFGDDSAETKASHLQVLLRVDNLSTTKKIDYTTWASVGFRSDDDAKLQDSFDNNYREVDFGTDRVEGLTFSQSIYPGGSLTDVLVFEAPVAAAKALTLTLRGRNVGETERIQLALPTPRPGRPVFPKQSGNQNQQAPSAEEPVLYQFTAHHLAEARKQAARAGGITAEMMALLNRFAKDEDSLSNDERKTLNRWVAEQNAAATRAEFVRKAEEEARKEKARQDAEKAKAEAAEKWKAGAPKRREDAAASRLKLIKVLYETPRRQEEAIDQLRKMVKEDAGTAAVKEAQQILDALKK